MRSEGMGAAFLDQIGKYRVEEKERLTREWRANCWKRLNPQMHAALKRFADLDDMEDKDMFLESLGRQWALSISQLFEGVEKPDIMLLSALRSRIRDGDEEMRLRMENEIEDIEFRLKRGSDMGRFDQFWDNNTLFDCRYSRSKWVGLHSSSIPLEVYSHALKENRGDRNIIHITFYNKSDFDVNLFLCDLPWVTSISLDLLGTIPAVRRDLLFIKSANNDLNTFAKEIKLDPSSTYIFSDAGIHDLYLGRLVKNARVLISFVAQKRLILRVKHSGEEDEPLEVTLGPTTIQLNLSSKSSLTIDDITLYPIGVSGPSESVYLSFTPEVRNDIFIRFIGRDDNYWYGHYLHDIELLDDAGMEYMPRSVSLSKLSN